MMVVTVRRDSVSSSAIQRVERRATEHFEKGRELIKEAKGLKWSGGGLPEPFHARRRSLFGFLVA